MVEHSKYRANLLKIAKSRKTKINNSCGTYDAYKYYRKNKPKEAKYILTYKEYSGIVKAKNMLLSEELLKGNNLIFPQRLGNLELRKYKTSISFKNGKLKTNLPIDWKRTIELWATDEEAKVNKVLIRYEVDYVYKVFYTKSKANYNNKIFYSFSVNRRLKQRIKNKIKEGVLDAFSIK